MTQKENLLTLHSLLSLRGRQGSSSSSHSHARRLTQPGASLINPTTPRRWKPWETRAESGSVGRHRASEQRHRVHFLLWFYLSSRAGTGTWNMHFGSLHYLFLSAAAYKESHARHCRFWEAKSSYVEPEVLFLNVQVLAIIWWYSAFSNLLIGQNKVRSNLTGHVFKATCAGMTFLPGCPSLRGNHFISCSCSAAW